MMNCKGLRFKAKINGTPCGGKVQVEDTDIYLCQNDADRGDCLDKLEFRYSWSVGRGTEEDLQNSDVTDFEIVPRDPETYQDWQVGDKVKRIVDELIANEEVIFRSGELVVCKTDNETASQNYLCDELFNDGYRLVLTDIEKQIIEKKKWKPQDGDIVAWVDGKNDMPPYAVSIYKGKDRAYATVLAYGSTEYSTYATFSMNIIRPATDEEKQRLFDAMAKDGKRWNAEEKAVEDIPKPYEFRKGEPVLVRVGKTTKWHFKVFVRVTERKYPYVATNGQQETEWGQCLPYNEKTMHLLGTSEDYKEE